MDAEKGHEVQEVDQNVSKFQNLKTWLTPKKLLVGCVLLVCMLAVMFGMGILSAQYVESEARLDDEAIMIEGMGHGSTHGFVRRHDDHDHDGVPIPISTQTALTTLYSFSHAPEVTTKTETVTGYTYITVEEPEPFTSVSLVTIESSSEVCNMEVITMTQSVTITVIPTPSSPEDATVTGGPSTVTAVQTDLSILSGLPDATVSGNPDTVTNVKTDWSVSSGLPDATISGDPATVTNVQTDFSITSGLPDATVSGSPSTVTEVQHSYSVTGIMTVITISGDLYPPKHTLSTVTKVTTIQKTITTHESAIVVVTISQPYSDLSTFVGATSQAAGEAITAASPSPSTTLTIFVTETSGEPLLSTTTVQVFEPPYPTANNTIANGASGTVTVLPNPTTPVVVVSGGSKKPEPRGWGGGTGTSNLGCAIMLIATIMFML